MNLEEVKAAMAERDTAIIGRLDSIDKALVENAKKWDEREDIESQLSAPRKPGDETKESREHKRLFCNWLRKPRDGGTKQALGDFQEKKSVNLGSSADGAFAVPEEISREIEKLEIKLSPVRRLVKVVQVGTGDFKQLVNIGGADAGWVGETDTRTETNTPQLRERAPTFGEIYAYPKATEHSIDDIFFNVQNWLVEEVSEQFALYEGEAVIRGNGSNKPTGMLNTAPVSTADDASPKRAAAAYQYINSGDNSPAAVDADALIDVLYSLNSKYLAGAAWTMNSNTAGAIRKLKTSGSGDYVWQPALTAGQPPMLLGHPVELWEQMDNIGGGYLPVAFGNFSRGYLLADRTQIRITVDNNITTPGYVKFFVRRREGGCVLNNDAIKWLRCL